MVGTQGKSFSVGELAAAMTGLLDAAREVKDTGQFGFLDRCVTTPALCKLMRI